MDTQHTPTPECENCKAASSGHDRKHYCELHEPDYTDRRHSEWCDANGAYGNECNCGRWTKDEADKAIGKSHHHAPSEKWKTKWHLRSCNAVSYDHPCDCVERAINNFEVILSALKSSHLPCEGEDCLTCKAIARAEGK